MPVAVVDADPAARSYLASQLGAGASEFESIRAAGVLIGGGPLVLVLGPSCANGGGLDEMTATVSARPEVGTILVTEALSSLPTAIIGPNAEGPKDDPGIPGVLGNGGPDAAGYRWLDSNDPNGPAFSWIDITGVGTPIPFTGDDQNQGPIALPFSFPFYNGSFNSVRVCTNGWLSFTSTLTTFTNTALPSGGATAPENLIAPFWDDLTFSVAGDAYYYYDGTKFIVSWVAVPRLGSGGPYTFQVLLYPSGTIDSIRRTRSGS